MKVKYKKALRKKKVVVIAAAVVLLSLCVVLYAYSNKIWIFEVKNSLTAEKNNSDSTNPQTKDKSGATNKNVDVTKNTDTIPISNDTSITISQLTQDDNNVTYSITITNPGNSGTCSAIFTNPLSQPVTSTVDASGNSCGPVSIPKVQFASLGSWTLTVRYFTGNTQSVVSRDIEIK